MYRYLKKHNSKDPVIQNLLFGLFTLNLWIDYSGEVSNYPTLLTKVRELSPFFNKHSSKFFMYTGEKYNEGE